MPTFVFVILIINDKKLNKMGITKKDVIATVVLIAAAFIGTTAALMARDKGFMVKKAETPAAE